MKYDKMTLEELEKLNQEKMAGRSKIRLEQREITIAIDKKLAAGVINDKVASMSDDEKTEMAAVLAKSKPTAQIIEPQPIESEESFNVPATG